MKNLHRIFGQVFVLSIFISFLSLLTVIFPSAANAQVTDVPDVILEAAQCNVAIPGSDNPACRSGDHGAWRGSLLLSFRYSAQFLIRWRLPDPNRPATSCQGRSPKKGSRAWDGGDWAGPKDPNGGIDTTDVFVYGGAGAANGYDFLITCENALGDSEGDDLLIALDPEGLAGPTGFGRPYWNSFTITGPLPGGPTIPYTPGPIFFNPGDDIRFAWDATVDGPYIGSCVATGSWPKGYSSPTQSDQVNLDVSGGHGPIFYYVVSCTNDDGRTKRSVRIVVDNTPPVTTCRIGGVNCDGVRSAPGAVANFSCSDPGGSGCNTSSPKSCVYNKNTATTCTPTTGSSYTFSTSGRYGVRFHSTDLAGNTETIQEANVRITQPGTYFLEVKVFLDPWPHNSTGTTGFGGANIQLSRLCGTTNSGITPANGILTFADCIPRSYTISFNPFPVGHLPVNPNPPTISKTITSSDVSATFWIDPAYTISGGVFEDINNNGTWQQPPDLYYTGGIVITSSPTSHITQYPGPGQYTLTVLSGPYTVSYTPPPNFQFAGSYTNSYFTTVGNPPGCVKGSNPDASCLGDNVQNLNYLITDATPWFQGLGGDMRIDSGFKDKVAPLDYASLDGSGGTPGVIFSGAAPYGFCRGQGAAVCKNRSSSSQWIVGGTSYSEVFNTSAVIRTAYDYLLRNFDQSGITLDTTTLSTCTSSPGCAIPTTSGLYHALNTIYLSASSIPANASILILVDGDVHILGNIFLDINNASLMISASGNIYVDKTVGRVPTNPAPNLQGFFSADKDFIIEGGDPLGNGANCPLTPDKRLNIQGAVIVNAGKTAPAGKITNQRNLCANNVNYPSYYIGERPNLILFTPFYAKDKPFTWREVVP